MDKIVLKLWTDNSSLTEIFQSVDIKFAHVNDKYEQVHQPCKCRDFLGDMMYSRTREKPIHIYGMHYDYTENPYDNETTRLSLKFPSKDQRENFINNFVYLTSREEAHGIPKSIILDTDQENTLIIEGHKDWQSAVWKLSLYTFYMKVMSYQHTNELKSPEQQYREGLTDSMEALFLKNIQNDKVNEIEKSLESNHNSSGFYTMIYIYNNKKHYKEHNYKGATIDNLKVILGDTW